VSAAESTDPATTTTTSTTTTAPPTTSTVPPTTLPPTTLPPTTSSPPSTTSVVPTTTVGDDRSTTTTTAPPSNTPDDPTATAPEGSAGPLDETGLDQQQVAELLALQRQYDELVAAEAVYLAEYEMSLRLVERLDADLAVLDGEIAHTERLVELARSDVERITADLRENEIWLRRTEAELATAIDRLRQQAVDSFIFGGAPIPQSWDALFDAREAHKLEVANAYANAVVEDQQEAVDRIRHLEEELEQIRAVIDTNRQAAEQARRQVEILERQLEAQRRRVQGERDRAEAERSRLDSLLAEMRRRKAAFDDRLQTMAVESDNIASVLARAQGDQQRAAQPPLMRGPVDPTVITSGYGPRMHPIFQTVRQHSGVDISGGMGDPIRAIEGGVVVMAELRNGYGNTIVVDHGDKVASVYAHLSRFEVNVGDVIARGELIGRIGSTGWSTGPHLHLEIRLAGKAIDPSGFLLLNEPVSCEVLAQSGHPLDIALYAERGDC
jgi:murein DD-endopeptidase MepM/ murein hydrolase activator NlpD